jgi:hypothetical protein
MSYVGDGLAHEFDGQFQLGAERRPVPRVDAHQVLGPDIEPGKQRQGDGAPRRVPGQNGQDHPDVAVHERSAGRAGGRIVVDAGRQGQRI